MNSLRTQVARTALAAAAATALTLGTGAANASAAQTDYIKACGTLTCSEYFSHRATVQLDEAVQNGNNVVGGAIGTVCDSGAELPGGVAATVFCLGTEGSNRFFANIKSIIHHAATTNGCVRFRGPRGVKSVRFAVYADHSATCHSMD